MRLRATALSLLTFTVVAVQAQVPLELVDARVVRYPPLARLAKIEGVVARNFTLEPDGSVGFVRVVAGHPILQPAARETLKSLRFTEGRPEGSNERFRAAVHFFIDEEDYRGFEYRGAVSHVVPGGGCPPVNRSPPIGPLVDEDYVELSRTFPSYRLRLYADGRLEWEGGYAVDSEGVRARRLGPEEARSAVELFRSPEVWRLCADYSASMTHGGTTRLNISISGELKTVEDYGERSPFWFRQLQAELDHATDSHRWRHGDPQSEPLYNIDAEYLPKPGLTELMRSAAKGDLARLQQLLSHGAEVDAVDFNGWTALMYAAAGAYGSAVSPLLAAGADPDHRSHFGDTPLMAAALKGWFDEELAEAGADVNAQNQNGVSALMLLAVTADPEDVKSALSAGADPSLRDVQGRTALDYLREVDCHRNPIRGFRTFLEFAAPCNGFSSRRTRRLRRLLR